MFVVMIEIGTFVAYMLWFGVACVIQNRIHVYYMVMSHQHYDTIIVGTGMAGLYSAHQIKKQHPQTTFLVLERNTKSHIGGRTYKESFYGTDIDTGAGVGRKPKDKLLYSLLRELDVPAYEYTSKINSLVENHPKVDIRAMFTTAKTQGDAHDTTFQEGFVRLFGEKKYQDFLDTAGFTDYEHADMYETLYHYGMEDNLGGWIGFGVPWKQLVDKLYHVIGEQHFRFSTGVEKIRRMSSVKRGFEISTEKGVYFANRVIVATDIEGIRRIVPGASNPESIYRKIHGQAFLKLYAKFNKESSDLVKSRVKEFTIVPGPLQKIIPMNAEKGVYMISYSDNQHAKQLKRHLENTSKNRDFFCRVLEQTLGLPKYALSILSLRAHYWTVGTHYYEPLGKDWSQLAEEFQYPRPGILVVGEAVSEHQGWVEGALETVMLGLTKSWMQSEE